MCSSLQKSPANSLRTVTAHHTKRNPQNRAIRRGLQIQQEVTEKTEGRVHLRSLRCLLFKSPGTARSRRTTQAQRPDPRDAWIATATLSPGSLQRIDSAVSRPYPSLRHSGGVSTNELCWTDERLGSTEITCHSCRRRGLIKPVGPRFRNRNR